ncbi:MAG: HEAT repeat domain-containing protein, partial [Planctomycetota bacterium]
MIQPKQILPQTPSRAQRYAVALFLIFNVVAWANWANAQNTQPDPPTRLTTTQQLQLEHLLEDLADNRLTLERRRNATIILIDDAWPQATRALRNLLTSADDETVRAIAQALTMAVTPPPELLAPQLLERLNSPDDLLRQDLAQALARYPSQVVLDPLVTLAADPQKPIDHRLGAIKTLGSHRTRQSADALLGLAQTAQPNIPPAAFEALAQLTGMGHLGQNLQEWNRW